MHWKSGSWILIGVLLTVLTATATAQIATTQVADTIYHADGTPATGTAIVNWPAFTTSNGDVIPSGSTSMVIGAGGALSIQLIPNAGSTPIGSYYTVVYHLDDGSVSRQYWIVPVSSAPIKISATQASVLPTSVAMQTVSKGYVDTAIAAAVTGHPLDSTPLVLKAGDAMTGPLVLPSDPVSANQAADKNYVDETIAAVSSGLGQKASMAGDIGGTSSSPLITGIQGKAVSAAPPATGQTPTWNGTAYVPSSPGYAGVAVPVNATTSTAQLGSNKLPRIDVTYPSFGADPTGTTDSTSAINAAAAFAASQITAGVAVPALYFPHGKYLIGGEIILSADLNVLGDAFDASVLSLTNNSATGLKFTGGLVGGYTSQGSLRDITIIAANNHNYTADMIELLNATGFRLENVRLFGGGGRGINVVGDTERITGNNIYIDEVRWPIVSTGDTDHWSNIHINSGGQSGNESSPSIYSGGYCWDANCPNGIWPMTGWSGAQTTSSAVGTGGTVTFQVTGNTTGGTNNTTNVGGSGISPIQPGHFFQIAGATGTTCVNGYWIAGTVTNNSPSSGKYTIAATQYVNSTTGVTTTASCTGTAGLGATTTGTASSSSTALTIASATGTANGQLVTATNIPAGTFVASGGGTTSIVLSQATTGAVSGSVVFSVQFTPVIAPDINPCVYLRGAQPQLLGGEIKTIQHCAAVVSSAAGGVASGLYIENYSPGGTPAAEIPPMLNAGFEIGGGDPYTTTLTSALPGTSSPTTATVASTLWSPVYVNDASDVSSVSNPFGAVIVPCDFVPGSSTASGCPGIPGGVTKGTFEKVQFVATSAGISITSRGGSTAWPIGSQVGIEPPAGGDPLNIVDTFSSTSPGGSNWAPLAVDGTPYQVAPIHVGNIPNGVSSLTFLQEEAVSFPSGYLSGSVNIIGGGGCQPGDTELIPACAVKGSGGGAAITVNNLAHGNTAGQDVGPISQGQLNQNNGSQLNEYNAVAPDGSVAPMTYRDLNSGTIINFPGGTVSASNGEGFVTNISNPLDPIVGSNAGYYQGVQYGNNWCAYDMGASTGAHALSAFCLYGGPANTPSLSYGTWNSGTQIYTPNITMNPATGAADFVGTLTVGGNINLTGYLYGGLASTGSAGSFTSSSGNTWHVSGPNICCGAGNQGPNIDFNTWSSAIGSTLTKQGGIGINTDSTSHYGIALDFVPNNGAGTLTHMIWASDYSSGSSLSFMNGLNNCPLVGGMCFGPNSTIDAAGDITGKSLSLSGSGCAPGTYAKADGSGCGPGGVSPAITIAPSDSPQTGATITLTGSSDQTEINTAIDTYCAPDNVSTDVPGCDITILYGKVNVTGSIVINRSDVHLHGQGFSTYGGVNSASYGGTQIVATSDSGSFPLVTVTATTQCGGTGSDTGRCRGISIDNLLLRCYDTSQTGIYDPGTTDNEKITNNTIQFCNWGVNVSADSPEIARNNMQYNLGGVNAGGVFALISNNLIYDNPFTGGSLTSAIEAQGQSAKVIGNTLGSTNHNGGGWNIIIGQNGVVQGNTIWNPVYPAINAYSPGTMAGAVITGNTIVQNFASTQDWIQIGTTCVGRIIANNTGTLVGGETQTGYFIDLNPSGCTYCTMANNVITTPTGSAASYFLNGLYNIGSNAQNATNTIAGNTGLSFTFLYSAAGTALPTCNAALQGTAYTVSDATSPTFMGAYTSGGGVTTGVICSYNGSSYAWLTR